jgi:transcriptional regulator with XRE-family HTH domain
MNNEIHEGRNIRIFREIRGLKQEDLARLLGEGWSKRKISNIELKKRVSAAEIVEIGEALDIPPSIIFIFTVDKFISTAMKTNMYSYGLQM